LEEAKNLIVIAKSGSFSNQESSPIDQKNVYSLALAE